MAVYHRNMGSWFKDTSKAWEMYGRSIGNIASIDIAQNMELTRHGKYLATKPGAKYGRGSSLKGMHALTYTYIFRDSPTHSLCLSRSLCLSGPYFNGLKCKFEPRSVRSVVEGSLELLLF